MLAQQLAEALRDLRSVLAAVVLPRDADFEAGGMQQLQAFNGLAEVPEAALRVMRGFVGCVQADAEMTCRESPSLRPRACFGRCREWR